MPTLGAFVVFQHNPERLERCLQSLQGVADEIVAIDSGATDGSRAVADRLATRVVENPWPDAFDDAYNFALKQIESEWTLWLDSDEWLDEGSAEQIRKAIQDRHVFAYNLLRRDHFQGGATSEMHMLRLWRSHPSLRLVGVIHAQFPVGALNTAARGRKIANTGITFSHDGFFEGFNPEKAERNLRFLERELELRPNQLYFEIALAEARLETNKEGAWDDAVRVVDKALQSGEWRTSAQFPLLVTLYLDYVPEDQYDAPLTERMAQMAAKYYADYPGVIWTLARLDFKRGRYGDSLACLDRVAQLRATGQYERHSSFDARIFGPMLELGVYEVATAMGNHELAGQAKEYLAKHGIDVDNLSSNPEPSS